MQVFFSYIVCPECHAHNTPWRTFCKICRGPLRSTQWRALAHTDITVTLYRSLHTEELLVFSPQYLAYQTPGLSIQTAWENIVSLQSDRAGPYLGLRKPAALSIDHVRFPATRQASQRIPLRPFGYPQHQPLRRDLARYLPAPLRRRLTL